MNWLSKIFGKIKAENTVFNPVVETLPEEQSQDILKDLFVDETPHEPIREVDLKSESILKQFLDQNYWPKGFNDAYETHSFEVLAYNKRKIRAEFRFVVDQLIDGKNREIFSLRNELITTNGIAEQLHNQLQLRIEKLQSDIKELEMQKEMSVEDEGLVMVPIHKYHEGFVRGVQTYEEQKHFASSTGLF